MAILRWTSFHEIVAAVTDEPGGEVKIALAGYESQHMVTREAAIKDLTDAADWIEGEKDTA